MGKAQVWKKSAQIFKLLSRVRLHLLPVPKLQKLKTKTFCLSELIIFDSVIKKAIEDKKFSPAEWSKSTGKCFCNRNSFSILSVVGAIGNKTQTDVYLLYGKNFQDKANMEQLPKLFAPMFIKKYYNLYAVNLNGTIYVLEGPDSGGKNVMQKITPSFSEKMDACRRNSELQAQLDGLLVPQQGLNLGGTFNDTIQPSVCASTLWRGNTTLGMLKERTFAVYIFD